MIDGKFIFLTFLVLCANTVETITGFGSTIICVTVGAHFFSIEHLVVLLVPLNIIISAYIVIRHRASINYPELLRNILPITGIGLAAGIFIFNSIKVESLKLPYGIFVLFFSVYELVRLARSGGEADERPLSRIQSAFWLAAGGVMQGIYASGGPMIVYYSGRKLKEKSEFRSTLSCLWLILNTAMFAGHLATGKANLETLKEGGLLFPALIAGIFIGEWIHTRIPEKIFRAFVFAFLTAAGASLIFK